MGFFLIIGRFILLIDCDINLSSSIANNIFVKEKYEKTNSPIYFSKLSQISFRKTHIMLVKAGEFVPVIFLPRLIPAAEVKNYGMIH